MFIQQIQFKRLNERFIGKEIKQAWGIVEGIVGASAW